MIHGLRDIDIIEQSPPRPLRHALVLVRAAWIAAGVTCCLLLVNMGIVP